MSNDEKINPCEFDCDPSGPNSDIHAPRCPIALEERVAGLVAALEKVKRSESSPRIIGIVEDALRDSSPLLAKVRAEAKAESFEEAANEVRCWDASVFPATGCQGNPSPCFDCMQAARLQGKAAALRAIRKEAIT